jgi:hypothetical protein
MIRHCCAYVLLPRPQGCDSSLDADPIPLDTEGLGGGLEAQHPEQGGDDSQWWLQPSMSWASVSLEVPISYLDDSEIPPDVDRSDPVSASAS